MKMDGDGEEREREMDELPSLMKMKMGGEREMDEDGP